MTVLLGTLFLAPFVFLCVGLATGASWTAVCGVQVALILLMRVLQAARFGHWETVLLFPLSIVSLIAIQWGSLHRTLRRTSVSWKGRSYESAGSPPSEPQDQREVPL